MLKKAVLVIVLCAAVAGAYFWGASTVEKRLRAAVAETGITVRKISVRPAWASLLRGRTGLEVELMAPELSLRFRKDGISGFSLAPLRGSRGTRFPVVQLRVREGSATVLDQTVTPDVVWNIRGLDLLALADWKTRECSFEGAGLLADSGGRESGRVRMQGSAVLIQGPVDALVSLRHDRLGDLAPYLHQVLGATPTRGTVDVSSKVTLHGGVLMSRNEVTASGVGFPTDEPTVLGPDGNRLVQLLQDADGSVHLSFIVTGEIGKGLDWSDLGAGAMREAIQQAMARGIQRVLSGTEQQPVEDAVRRGMDSLGR